ncbi:hypothetical protein ABVK25_008731 [Lepraria finkii]|uniref:Amino acid transporter n=1 Tax=Lepraria finkii TaxID=1340010 RepID=A0ABR4B083_9LECA
MAFDGLETTADVIEKVSDVFDIVGFTKADEADMAKQNKQQQFHRRFNFLTLLSFTAATMATWEAVLFSNNTAMYNGGPVTLIYGFIFCWISALTTAASLAEMASMAPTSGGQYHWVSMLAPPRYSIFLSWITGWFATLGWIANLTAGVWFSGTMIQGLFVLNYPSYVYERWHGTLLLFAALLCCVAVNTLLGRIFPHIEGFVLLLHIAGFLAILIPLAVMAPKGSPSSVFAQFTDVAGWNSNGLAWFVGLISSNLPFIGYDGPCHLAEEVRNASTVVPWAIICTVLLNGTLGLAICIAFSFTLGDLPTDLMSATGYDFIQVFFGATNSHAGSSVMTAILIALVTCASFGFLASASRQTWAFARDKGLPFSGFLSYVDKRTALPLRSIFFCTVISAVIGLINIGSTAAFNAIVSLTIAGLFISYLTPIGLMIVKRVKGETIEFGPWSLGRAGFPVNTISAGSLIISVIFSFFPPSIPVTLVTMNWSCLMWGGSTLIGLAYYAVRGRKIYHGPIVERPIIMGEKPDL